MNILIFGTGLNRNQNTLFVNKVGAVGISIGDGQGCGKMKINFNE